MPSRRLRSSLRALLVAAVAVSATACRPAPADEQTLTSFFEWSRIYDTTRLAPIATVVFNPRVEGVVDRFEILDRRDTVSTGDRAGREVRIRASVWSPAGERADRTLLMTLERSGERGWMVTGFTWGE